MNKKRVWILLLAIVAIAAAWLYSARAPIEEHPSELAAPAIQPPPPSPSYPVTRPEPPAVAESEQPAPVVEPLPPLADSDPVLVAEMTEWVGPEVVADWLVTEQFVNRVVATVDSLTSRQLAPRVLPVRPPQGTYRVSGEGDAWVPAQDNAERYRHHVELLAAMDVDTAVQLYRRYYPLFQEAYESLGYPGSYFNDRLVEVIDHLLATPEPDQPPVLVKPEAVYLFEDESLESLSAGQKLLLRIGEDQRRAAREKLEAIRAEITAGSGA